MKTPGESPLRRSPRRIAKRSPLPLDSLATATVKKNKLPKMVLYKKDEQETVEKTENQTKNNEEIGQETENKSSTTLTDNEFTEIINNAHLRSCEEDKDNERVNLGGK